MSTRKSLLLVDADTRSLRVLEVSLRKAGFKVNTAESGTSALSWAFTEPPDLVICDTSLPDFSGFELCQRLRSDSRTRHSVVVFLTEEASPETKIAGINSGADDFLTKPVLVKEIVSRVKTLLEKRRTDSLARRERPGNLSGTLANMGVVDLLQVMETGQKSGIVHVSSDAFKSGGFVTDGEERGTIFFRDGEVIDARLGKLTGLEAVYRMLLWDDGVFEIEFKSIAREDTVNTSTQTILLEGMRRVDEWSRFSDLIPPVNGRLTVDYQALTQAYPDVPGEMRPVLHLFDGRRTVFEIVSDTPGDDGIALNVIADLHRYNILQAAHAAPGGEGVEEWLSSGPSPVATDVNLPSALGNAMIPSPDSASQILAAISPDEMQTPEATAVPEPLPEPSLVLSRHTVPANRSNDVTEDVEDPIPLSQTRPPRLRIQRVASTIGRLPTAAPAAARAPTIEFEDDEEEDGWEAVRTAPSPTGLRPAERPTAQPLASRIPASQSGNYVIAPAAPPPWPVANKPAPVAPEAEPDLLDREEDEENTDVGQQKIIAAARENTEIDAGPTKPPAIRSNDFDKPAMSSEWYNKSESGDELIWEGESSPWKARLPGLLLIASVVAVVAVLLAGGRDEHGKKPEGEVTAAVAPEAKAKAKAKAPAKRAGWPTTDQAAVIVEDGKAKTKAVEATPDGTKAPPPGSAVPPPAKAPPAVAEKAPPPPPPPAAKAPPPAPKVDTNASAAAAAKGEKQLTGGSLRSARSAFKQAIAANPDNAEAHSGLAMVYVEMGQDRSAKAEAWRALKIDSGQARAHLVLALIAANSSDMDKAKVSYQRYLKLAPNGKHAGEVRRILKTLQ